MKVIGLTGGIGTGKSTVSQYLREKGCVILDSDEMARNMTEKGNPALEEIRESFGTEYFFEDGSLDRKKLGNLVFNDVTKKEKLEEIITKKVVEENVRIIDNLRNDRFGGIVIVDAPLLFECKINNITDEDWLVTCELETRINRVVSRDNVKREQVIDRINNQMPEEEKKKLATRIIDNSYDLEYLHKQIDEILELQA